MRAAAIIVLIVVASLAVRKLYAFHTAPSVTLAILVAGGTLVMAAFVLRNAPRAPARRARGAVPEDRGIPKPPTGAPYRGPF